ncbi:MAG: inorganic pyrophosphatase [Erysipelotrichaceae bacterium]|nr:inorganic pyrophosphatase [Erysipelotrichaceae bacterium]
MLDQKVKVIVDHPYGSMHPFIPDLECPTNMGYVIVPENGDLETYDAYVVGIYEPVSEFEGYVAATIERRDWERYRFVVVGSPEYDRQQIIDAIGATELDYDIHINWIEGEAG